MALPAPLQSHKERWGQQDLPEESPATIPSSLSPGSGNPTHLSAVTAPMTDGTLIFTRACCLSQQPSTHHTFGRQGNSFSSWKRDGFYDGPFLVTFPQSLAWQEGKLSQTQTLRKGRGSRGVGSRRMWGMNQWDPAGPTSEGLGKTHPAPGGSGDVQDAELQQMREVRLRRGRKGGSREEGGWRVPSTINATALPRAQGSKLPPGVCTQQKLQAGLESGFGFYLRPCLSSGKENKRAF